MEEATSLIDGRTALGLALSVVGVVGARAAVRARTRGSAAGVAASKEAQLRAFISAKVHVSNAYTAINGPAGRGYPFLADTALVEPYRDTTFWLDDGESDVATQSDMSALIWDTEIEMLGLIWQATQITGIADGASAENHIHVGSTATIQFKSVGDFKVQVTPSKSSSAAATRTVTCRYVRRNIRKLFAEDRDAFFDAFKTMLANSTEDGAAIYGESYKSIDYFTEIHLNKAATRRADHMHDGMGFLTQHVALSNSFELSLQSIKPNMALPYWDITEDETLARTQYGGESRGLWQTDLWSDDWFGNATGSPAHVVEKGRFAYQRVSNGAQGALAVNPYGYLRAPWNVNKSPYLTRAHSFCGETFSLDLWPSCVSHYNMTFDPAYDTWYDYVWTAGYAPHGPVHYFIGGYVNCGDLGTTFDGLLDDVAVNSLSLMLIGIPKNFWRDYYTESPTFCTADTAQEDCHMMCSGEPDDDEWAGEVMAKLLFYAEKFALTGLDISYQWLEDMSPEDYAPFLRIFCTMAWSPGEQMEAASPADVSFWPIHPTMERLLQYKMIVRPFTDLNWANDASNDNLPGDGTTLCEYTDESQCEGHHGYDITTFVTSSIDPNTGVVTNDYLTNGELLHSIDPNDYKMTYVYDNFEWPHCAEHHGLNFLSATGPPHGNLGLDAARR